MIHGQTKLAHLFFLQVELHVGFPKIIVVFLYILTAGFLRRKVEITEVMVEISLLQDAIVS